MTHRTLSPRATVAAFAAVMLAAGTADSYASALLLTRTGGYVPTWRIIRMDSQFIRTIEVTA